MVPVQHPGRSSVPASRTTERAAATAPVGDARSDARRGADAKRAERLRLIGGARSVCEFFCALLDFLDRARRRPPVKDLLRRRTTCAGRAASFLFVTTPPSTGQWRRAPTTVVPPSLQFRRLFGAPPMFSVDRAPPGLAWNVSS